MAHLCRLPVDTRLGTPRGPLEQLNHDSSLWWSIYGTRARFSIDGRRLVFASERSGIVISGSGICKPVGSLRCTDSEDRPALSRSGAYTAYLPGEGPRKSISISDVRNGPPRLLCDDCGEPTAGPSTTPDPVSSIQRVVLGSTQLTGAGPGSPFHLTTSYPNATCSRMANGWRC
jgi:hypothetical protein